MSKELNAHILIVEYDPIQRETIRAAIEYCGYTSDTATNAASALGRLRSRSPDAIVADLDLRDCDGLELISVMRRLSDAPIIALSGSRAEANKIAALDQGADDYIEKPFLPGEFVARIRAKLRQYRSRGLGESERPYEISPDTDVYLSKLERGLLALLVQHQGATVSEDEIIAALWGSSGGATSADLRSLVLKLRRKLEIQRQPLFVLNQRGVGYYVSGFGRFPQQERGVPQVPQTAPRPAEPRQAVRSFARDAIQSAVEPSATQPVSPRADSNDTQGSRGQNESSSSILMMPEKSLPAPPWPAKRA